MSYRMQSDYDPNKEYPLATVRHRLGGAAVDNGYGLLSFGLVFFWGLFTWMHGQTPGMETVRLKVVHSETGMPINWRHMAIRTFLIPWAYSIIPGILMLIGLFQSSFGSVSGLYIFGMILLFVIYGIDYLWMYRGDKRQRLTDVWAKTVVINIAA
jgi:uncharacterized RDD family membrane protein YckC